jgi:hypothetical protein
LVTFICQNMVLMWWFTSLRSSFIANCNVLSLLHTETVCENVTKHYIMEFNPFPLFLGFLFLYMFKLQ